MEHESEAPDWQTPRLQELSVGYDTAFEGGSATDGSTKDAGNNQPG